MFIGRDNELKGLSEKLNNDRFESILIYGRRRIGKTELIKEAIKNLNCVSVYFECKLSLLNENLIDFNNEVNRVLNCDFRFDSFKKILKFLFDYSRKEKIVLVIDEFPYLLQSKALIISDIRDLIDEYCMNSKMKIILSGSLVQVMKNLNDSSSETYGRFTSIIPLTAFDYFDSSKFYDNYSDEEKILMYSVFGGVAFFNSLIDSSLTALDNIKKIILNNNSILQLEV